MALGAMSANPGLNVRIVPVGLSYFHPHKFRSRAVVEFGAPLSVPRELVSLFDEGGEGKRKAVGQMMEILYDGLKSVTVRAPDYETLMFIQAGRRLYTPPGVHPTLSQVVELNRQFIIGYLKHKDEPRVIALKDDILKYNKMLNYAGLRDHQVERATRAGWRSLGLLVYRLFLLAFWGGLALPGVVLNSPIIILAKFISRKKAKEALAASQVKVAGRDVVATWKVLVSLGFTPVLYIVYAIVATVFAHKYKAPFRHQLLMPIYVLSILPTIAYSTLKFSEVGLDIYKSLPPLFVSLMPGNHRVIQELQETRASISSALHALIEELGPQTFDDFEQRRIFSARPSSLAPPAPNTPGREDSFIWKEKSSQDLSASEYLSHPLSWADERLFGWRASKAPTQARKSKTLGNSDGNNNQDQYPDENMTESTSEDSSEEEGDYEAIFSMLNPARLLGLDGARSPKSPRHSRSRSGSGTSFKEKRERSYSDLKGLSTSSPTSRKEPRPMSPTISRSSAYNQANSSRRRQRKHSLSEDVQVQDIQTEAQDKSFEEAGRQLEQHVIDQRGGESSKAVPALQDMREAEDTPSKPSTPVGR